MKKIHSTSFLLIFSLAACCQQLTGNWEGTLSVKEKEIPVVFHISTDSTGRLSSTFDSPSQGAYNLPCDETIIGADSVVFMMKILKGRFSGKINGDRKMITGTFYQSGFSLPLTLTKTSDVVKIKEFNRPQTPKPPFPYRSEDVEYDNADKSIQFGGTLTVPMPEPGVAYFREPVYPAVLLITGSGKQDRDETIMQHKPFAVIADYLSRHGIAVLRVDDRDMGKTTGNFNTSTTADFAKDVEAGINYLETRKEVDKNHIGLMGHSEGGMIAPMVAAERADVKFIVLLAGPGVPIIDLMQQQSIDVEASEGVSKNDLEKSSPLYKDLVTIIVKEKDTARSYHKAFEIFKNWQHHNTDSVVKNTTGVTDEKSLRAYLEGMIRELNSPWFNYFIQFNPGNYLSGVKCPVLAINGEKDIQVAAKPNLDAIRSALETSGNKHFIVREIAGVNHLFQHCKKCTVAEYEELEETFAPEVLELITGWINTLMK